MEHRGHTIKYYSLEDGRHTLRIDGISFGVCEGDPIENAEFVIDSIWPQTS